MMTDDQTPEAGFAQDMGAAFVEFAAALRNSDARLSLTLIATTCSCHAVTLELLGQKELADQLRAVDNSLRKALDSRRKQR